MLKKDLPTNYLKPIGSPVIYLGSHLQRGKKFNKKGLEGILVGFNPIFHSYLVLSSSGAIIETKHVQFLKNNLSQFPLLKSPGLDLFSQASLESDNSDFSSVEKQYNIWDSPEDPSESESDWEEKNCKDPTDLSTPSSPSQPIPAEQPEPSLYQRP